MADHEGADMAEASKTPYDRPTDEAREYRIRCSSSADRYDVNYLLNQLEQARRKVATEPDRTRAAVVKALREFAEGLTQDDAVPWDMYAYERVDAIENGAPL